MKDFNVIKKGKEILKIFAVIILLIVLSILLCVSYNITPIATTENNSIVATKIEEETPKNRFKLPDIFSKQVSVSNFNWEKDVDETIGKITIEDQGRKVSMTGNEMRPGKNAIYIIPENHQQQLFGFHYEVDYGDSFYAAGLLMRVKKANGYLTGYMLSFNNTSRLEWTGGLSSNYGSIWKFKYKLNDNNNSDVEKTLVKDLEIPQSGDIQIDSTAEEIKITGEITETIPINKNDPDVGEGFGFFTAHYSHDCQRIGNFALTNFAVTTIDIIPHKLIVDPNGGTWEGNAQNTELTGVYQDTRNIPLPQRDGYIFVRWDKTGTGGEMSTLTDPAVYTWGEDETDDKITAQWVKTEITKKQSVAEVTNGTEITYTLTASNSGTVESTAVISDTIPPETTFVNGSIAINGQTTQNTEQNLKSGITVKVPAGGSTTLTFKVKVKDLNDQQLIKNKANLKDTTVANRTQDKQSEEVVAKYVEPIISQTKEIVTEHGQNYVIAGEKITYTIVIKNDGGLAKNVIVKDTIPSGTTFVDGSIKLDGQPAVKENSQAPTKEDLASGITVTVPATSTRKLSFEVTTNDINNKDVIKNVATVDDNPTNEVTKEYIEPIISQTKEIATEHGQNYVIVGEKITFTIVVKNDGDLGKNVTIKDTIPTGTTFVDGSIKLDGQPVMKEGNQAPTKEDLASGIIIEVPGKTTKKLSFDVTADDINNKDVIKNVATVDDNPTNEVTKEYIEPIISQTKEMTTEKGQNYVIEGEKITYTIVVKNDGDLGKDVTIKDTIPEGTTFVDGSIKLDGQELNSENGAALTEANLSNGIIVEVPGRTTKKLSFEVIVEDIEDETKIENVATVDGNETNKVTTDYSEPIISEHKEAETEYGKEYVVGNEKITYKIIVKNTGTLSKFVTVKDTIPEGTTFVEGSIKIDGKEQKSLTEEDLEEGIEILVPARPGGNNIEQKDEQKDKQQDEEETKEDQQQKNNNENKQGSIIQEANANIESAEGLNLESVRSIVERSDKNSSKEIKLPDGYDGVDKLNIQSFIAANNEAKDEDEEDSKQESSEQESNKQEDEEFDADSTNAGIKTVSFEVIVDPLEKDTDTAQIDNVAMVDNIKTNKVSYDVYPFNMKIEQKIKSLTLNGTGSDVGDGKTAKTEVYRKAVNTSQVATTYEIVVTNTGKVPGTATVTDIIPNGYRVADNNPSYWVSGATGEITTTTKELKAGESQTLEVSLAWINGQDNFGEKVNEANIVSTKNDSNAEETTLEDNKSKTTEFVTVSTGVVQRSFQIMSLIMLPLFMIIVVGEDIIEKRRVRQEAYIKIDPKE